MACPLGKSLPVRVIANFDQLVHDQAAARVAPVEYSPLAAELEAAFALVHYRQVLEGCADVAVRRVDVKDAERCENERVAGQLRAWVAVR